MDKTKVDRTVMRLVRKVAKCTCPVVRMEIIDLLRKHKILTSKGVASRTEYFYNYVDQILLADMRILGIIETIREEGKN